MKSEWRIAGSKLKHYIIGQIITFTLLIAGASAVSGLIHNGIIGMDVLGYGTAIIYLVGSMASGIYFSGFCEDRLLIRCLINAAISVGIILVLNLAFGGSVVGIIYVGVVVIGSNLAVAFLLGGIKKRKKRGVHKYLNG